MNPALSYIETDVQTELEKETQATLSDEQLALIAGGQCTTNSI